MLVGKRMFSALFYGAPGSGGIAYLRFKVLILLWWAVSIIVFTPHKISTEYTGSRPSFVIRNGVAIGSSGLKDWPGDTDIFGERAKSET